MAERFVSKTTKTDFVGTYVEYVYPDGHRETDPPGRPKSREDVQRDRLEEAAGVKAQRQLEAQRSKLSAYGATTPDHIVRENLATVSGRDLTAPYHGTQHALQTAAETIRGPSGMADALIDNFDLGGVVEGSDREEYGPPTPDRKEEDKPGVKERRYPGRLR